MPNVKSCANLRVYIVNEHHNLLVLVNVQHKTWQEYPNFIKVIHSHALSVYNLIYFNIFLFYFASYSGSV